MSFQHFRLGQLAMSQPLPPHLQQNQPSSYSQNVPSVSSTSTTVASTSTAASATSLKPGLSRAPYGSGDSDDGYTLIFPSITAFHDWRRQEEETQMVEFVKGDTHGSKAVPPRFKDHTKLVCARHSRSGRKKYVKKHPERVRKIPSRKLEGQGCQASISYKTYFDTEDVRACYISEHSHPIGLANLPFTRRGRRVAVQEGKERSKRSSQPASSSVAPEGPSVGSGSPMPTPSVSTMNSGASGDPSSMSLSQQQQRHMPQYPPNISQFPQHFQPYQQSPHAPAPYQQMPPPATNAPSERERWDRMSVLFTSIRDHARAFEYPGSSIAALESVLIRLYLESPMGVVSGSGTGLGALGISMHGGGPHIQHGQGQGQGHGLGVHGVHPGAQGHDGSAPHDASGGVTQVNGGMENNMDGGT
ncbi:hypothetical protein SERLA73DRAFT_175937 [Serpula lacrymans var. lacrymans S7.3]|uniref:Uncharacterized protein n=2 Tax=Serpula lacrymans var. lacrymans TaxID=341189 RepID=F8PLG2_SERL3|nr:uncharacterized protein SERLADRAFT_458601 [Serpula lacrymans var. lacrymans S7.9]EGO02444.1 hypothetical protein SERLA73DRAFT_175937 [Serpula lacrymans var. lacrymans S7.3]EGO28172.1 hypothetical protein SERLADRAFT_458601 [Serpula lacrymans var. lacrymans S7.9]